MSPEPKSENALQPGLNAEVKITVSESETAAHMGSGLVPVYATPALVALMENAAVRALEEHLPPGKTTVGGQIDLRHLAATPVGMQVRARAELVEMQGRKLTFHIQAWDEAEQIGEANHIRFLIDEETFMTKVRTKANQS
jgi:fluoroacetyl-CoA thioesterase